MEKELKKYMTNVDDLIVLLKNKVDRLEGERDAALTPKTGEDE